MAGQIRIGCSGWNYRHWRELFYPKGLPMRRWYEHYASVFDTVELNTSFYHLPKPETFEKWRDQAPPDFRYAVKASRFITHMKKLRDCEEPLALLLDRARKLGPAIGPILYQLPPSLHLDPERLREFLAILPADLTHVFEFRHKSWYDEEALALLDERGVSFCVHDMASSATPRWAAGSAAYIRFHGAGGKYRGRYSDQALLGWTDWIVEQAKAGRDVWAFFNNDIGGDAIHDALTLRAMAAQAMR